MWIRLCLPGCEFRQRARHPSRPGQARLIRIGLRAVGTGERRAMAFARIGGGDAALRPGHLQRSQRDSDVHDRDTGGICSRTAAHRSQRMGQSGISGIRFYRPVQARDRSPHGSPNLFGRSKGLEHERRCSNSRRTGLAEAADGATRAISRPTEPAWPRQAT